MQAEKNALSVVISYKGLDVASNDVHGHVLFLQEQFLNSVCFLNSERQVKNGLDSGYHLECCIIHLYCNV